MTNLEEVFLKLGETEQVGQHTSKSEISHPISRQDVNFKRESINQLAQPMITESSVRIRIVLII